MGRASINISGASMGVLHGYILWLAYHTLRIKIGLKALSASLEPRRNTVYPPVSNWSRKASRQDAVLGKSSKLRKAASDASSRETPSVWSSR